MEAIGFGHRPDARGALVVCASPASGTDGTSNHPRARGDLAVTLEYGVSVEPAARDAREALLAGGEGRCCMNTLWGWGRASWAGCGPDVRRGGQTLIMGYSADKSPLIGHLAGPLRRLEPLVAQRQEKCGPNRPTPTGYSCNNASAGSSVPKCLRQL